MPLDPFFRSLWRIQEIIEATAGGRSGGGPAGARELLSCSFCGEHQSQIGHLIAGPGHYICDRCVGRAHAALAIPDMAASSPDAMIWRVSGADQADGCSFCGKSSYRVEAIAAADGGRICNECLELCQEIVADNMA